MCIICDANTIHDVKDKTPDGAVVLKWMLTGKGGMVIGGHLKREMAKSQKMLDTMTQLDRAGRLHTFEGADIEQLTIKLADKCHSDDPHVVALVQMSKCPLVFSRDKGLHKDLKNNELVGFGVSIYQNTTHDHLLTECKCKGPEQ